MTTKKSYASRLRSRARKQFSDGTCLEAAAREIDELRGLVRKLVRAIDAHEWSNELLNTARKTLGE